MGVNMSKTRRDEDQARKHAERARRGALRSEPVVVDFAKCWDGVERIFAELYGVEPPECPEDSRGEPILGSAQPKKCCNNRKGE
jgi:hypothetical protein